jgi:hypothetical protein
MTKRPIKRGRKPMPKGERKDQLVQTRVPGELSETLREAAKQHRVTVSQLIRNVLEDTFKLVDNVVAETVSLGQAVRRDARKIAESAQGRRSRPPAASALDQVDAWQEVLLNRDVVCARCEQSLARGTKAFFGVGSEPHATKVWLCQRCSTEL